MTTEGGIKATNRMNKWNQNSLILVRLCVRKFAASRNNQVSILVCYESAIAGVKRVDVKVCFALNLLENIIHTRRHSVRQRCEKDYEHVGQSSGRSMLSCGTMDKDKVF